MSSLVFFLVYKYILSLLVNLQDLLVKWNIFLGIVSPKLRMNQLKKYNDSLAEFDKALQIDNSQIDALYGKALVYYALNMNNKVKENLEKVLLLKNSKYESASSSLLNKINNDKKLRKCFIIFKIDKLNYKVYFIKFLIFMLFSY